MKKSNRARLQILLWIGSVLMVIGIGMYYMPQEADKPGICEALYSTLRLFVFERDLPTFPHAWPLIFIYFAAPLITLSALGSAINYLFRVSPGLRTRWMSDHVVVCGMGRTGTLIASTLKNEGISVAGVDRADSENFDDWRADNNVPILQGDFHSQAALEKAGADQARSLIFSSGDDLANFEGALLAYEWLRTKHGPVRIIWVHMADDSLADTARQAVLTEGKVGIRFFDTYQIAASRMLENHFGPQLREQIREVVIVGFGKFGCEVLEMLLQRLGPEEQLPIKVIDILDKAREVQRHAEHVNPQQKVSFVQCDIRDLQTQQESEKAYFLCTDDDLGNLSLALNLAPKVRGACIFVRMTHWPLASIEEHFGREHGIVFVNINDLLIQGLIANLPGTFHKPKGTDLKRVKPASG